MLPCVEVALNLAEHDPNVWETFKMIAYTSEGPGEKANDGVDGGVYLDRAVCLEAQPCNTSDPAGCNGPASQVLCCMPVAPS